MEVSQSRFELALTELKPSDWEKFERLSSIFVAAEWPGVRTMAAPSGDGGRDSELFSADGATGVALQYSVEKTWRNKITRTLKRLRETFPETRVLVFLSNQLIGAQADGLRKTSSEQGVFIDVRDRSWFIERANSDTARQEAANSLARAVVDPLLEAKGLAPRSAKALDRHEAGTALTFLEMQWRDEAADRGLTKSSFDALVRAALHGTTSDNRLSRAAVHDRVSEFLPQHGEDQLAPFVDAALRRLTKSAVRHWPKVDEFNLSHQESERLKDVAASIQLLNRAFEADLREILALIPDFPGEREIEIIDIVRDVVESYFLKRGEEFAALLARDEDPAVDAGELKSLIITRAPKVPFVKTRHNVELLSAVVSSALLNPSDQTREYLRLLSDAYTLFAFLSETPDVQAATKKLFGNGEIWFDTSALLPVFTEQALPEGLRPFTALLLQARAAGLKLLVSPGVIEEIERHFNRCMTYLRSTNWNGDVPYVYSRYLLAGGARDSFGSWLEQFQGTSRPEEDIALYLAEEFGVEVTAPPLPDNLDDELIDKITDYWKQVHDKRRPNEGFSISTNRLAEHDIEVCLAVLSKRKKDLGHAALGHSSWWLTLDSWAWKMIHELGLQQELKHTPTISIDFLLRYLAFGPRRDRVARVARNQPQLFATPVLEILPNDLVEVAQAVRSDSGGLPERVVQRRIRDALDRQKSKAGTVQKGGLQRFDDAISDFF
jgi:hypothetical protein